MASKDTVYTGRSWKRDSNMWKIETRHRERHRYYCTCGHSVMIPYNKDRKMCSWCKHWVDKKKADEKRYFKDKMRQLLNRKEE